MTDDGRLFAAATERNREPILAVLERVLPSEGAVLEIGSGTGQHAVFLAPRLKPRLWQPSDPDPRSRVSIVAWQTHSPSDNLLPPLELDACTPVWPMEETGELPIVAIASINMIHIAPWQACLGLIAGAGRILPVGGILYLYGPFKQAEHPTAPSNQAFDEMLRARDPSWGIRDLSEVIQTANEHQLLLLETVPMPANNLSVIFQHR